MGIKYGKAAEESMAKFIGLRKGQWRLNSDSQRAYLAAISTTAEYYGKMQDIAIGRHLDASIQKRIRQERKKAVDLKW